MLSNLMIAYLFLGGTGAGALALLVVVDISQSFSSSLVRGFVDSREPLPESGFSGALSQSALARCGVVAVVTVALAVLCLVLDIGRADRLLSLFLRPSFSYLTVGSYALLVLVLSATALCANWVGLWQVRNRWLLRALAALVLLAAVVTMLYPGLMFWSIGTGALLGTWLIPLLFLLSSLSCGVALIVGTGYLTSSFAAPLARHALARLVAADKKLLILELAGLAALLAWVYLTPSMAALFEALALGTFATTFWLGVVTVGVVVPFLLEGRSVGERVFAGLNLSLPSAACVLIGGACLRWTILNAGLPIFSP